MHGRHDASHHHHHPHSHNQPAKDAAQWQTPHDPHAGTVEAPISDEYRDLDLVEQTFCEAFATASDPTSFLRLAGVPFTGISPSGKTLHLLRVEQNAATDIGSVMPQLGGEDYRYDPLPARLTSRREKLVFIYFNGQSAEKLDLAAARALSNTATREMQK